jgi:hypothetical protein
VIAETIIFQTLTGLVAGRVYPDVAPLSAALPRIVYQQVGGASVTYTEGALPDKENGRFQIACWAKSRLEAVTLAKQAEFALVAGASFQAVPIGARASVYEDDTQLFGCRQDFSIWSAR